MELDKMTLKLDKRTFSAPRPERKVRAYKPIEPERTARIPGSGIAITVPGLGQSAQVTRQPNPAPELEQRVQGAPQDTHEPGYFEMVIYPPVLHMHGYVLGYKEIDKLDCLAF